ncbi:MAG: xanthine dehydrogenase family protein molybdopterin-binding subunit [Candidatus Aminicenantes bacterium]|nr:xanthine dehydrogenase family protein molybdopterin-binding subunit [Candidatus Aminicenantes bacterium]
MKNDSIGVDVNMAYLEEARGKEPRGQEIPALPEEDFQIIGSLKPRVDGRLIVTGKAPYTRDLSFDKLLYGRVLRSPYAAAEVVTIDLSEAQNLPGVKAVLKLKEGQVKYEGEPVAAVAAASQKAAEQAAGLIKVEYKRLPHVVSPEKAREESAPRVHESGNVEKFNEYSRGDLDKGFAEADVVMERTYKTAVEIHHTAETHVSIAKWEEDRLTVWDSTQAIFSVRDGLARALSIPASKVRVIKTYMGGGFGSKLGLNDHTVIAARLARKAGRPVKIVLSRKENALCVGNRPSTVITIKGGARKDGTLLALHMKNYTCGGVGRGDRSSEPLIDIYRCPHVKVEEYTVYTHTGASRPTRAPGHVQGTFALEGFLDELAAELGLDPLELRRRNSTSANQGDTGIPYSSKGLLKCYDQGAAKIGWARRNRKPGDGQGSKKRGLGMASQIWWGAGVPRTLADVKIHPDGSVEVISGTQDIGTGTRTYMATITAETLGLEPEAVTVKIGDTVYPWAPSSGGSQTTPSVSPAVRDAALKAAAALKRLAARKLEVSEEEVVLARGKLFARNYPERSLTFPEAARELRREAVFHGERGDLPAGFVYNSFGAHFAEVEVDTDTGEVRVLKVVAAHEVGRIINKLTAESQVHGGVIQGVSTALFEERLLDENTGQMVNANLQDYKIATSMDVPEIIPVFIDMVDPRINSLGTKGLGEPPRIPISAAIANAVYNAIGVHPREIPMTPDRVLSMLRRKEAGS